MFKAVSESSLAKAVFVSLSESLKQYHSFCIMIKLSVLWFVKDLILFQIYWNPVKSSIKLHGIHGIFDCISSGYTCHYWSLNLSWELSCIESMAAQKYTQKLLT